MAETIRNPIDRMAEFDNMLHTFAEDESPRVLDVLRYELARYGDVLQDEGLIAIAETGTKDEIIHTFGRINGLFTGIDLGVEPGLEEMDSQDEHH